MFEEREENSNKSLADNEIASLMKTLASKNYKENSSFPKKIVEPFKPTSFFEIAKKNISKDKSKFPKEKIDIDLKGDSTPQDNDIKEDNGKQFKEDKYKQNERTNPEIENNNDIQQIDLDQTDANSEILQEINEQSELYEDIGSSRNDPSLNVGVPIKENLYTKGDLNNEYQKGISEGVQQEQKKIIEEKENLIKYFDKLIKKINEKIFIDTNSLEKHIKQEIINIASERVGLLIDEMPKEFLEKIKSLSNTVRKKSEKKILKLNPDDLKSVEKIIQNETYFKQFVFLADKSLSRGDCVIEIGEISLEDKINDRYNINEDSSKYFEIENIDNGMSSLKQNSSQSVQKNEGFDTQNSSKKELINDPPFHQEQDKSQIELKDQTNGSNSSEQEIIDIDLNEEQKTIQTNKNDQIDKINNKLDNKDVDEFIELDNEMNDKLDNKNVDEFIELDPEIKDEINSNNKNKE